MRFLAAIIDGVILGVGQTVIGLIVSGNSAIPLQFLFGAVYTIGFWISQGATPGKMVMGIRLQMEDGEPITGGAAVIRYFGYILSVITLGIGYLMIAWHGQKRGLHDLIAGTVAVKTR
jgi:uncharacterized RDD family membrane protein YckC